jgi:hypothetical protein
MTVIELVQIERTYKNNGQHAEQVARFTLTGVIEKADNKPAEMGGDCGDIQIKSARATICKGDNLMKHLETDGANRYGYVTSDFTKMYLMDRKEYIEFVNEFGTLTRDSEKNGGGVKIRLKSESRAMMEWFERRA